MSDDAYDPASAGDDEAIVQEAKRRFDRCVEWESTFRRNARDDKRFANGDAYNRNQWDDAVIKTRTDRPSLTINKTRQHILQICNDQRQHKTQIKVSPTGGEATYEAAIVFSACIRRIEAQSKALDAYSTAGADQVETGLGFVRIVTEYVTDTAGPGAFDQDIFIRREPEPLSIYLDPDAKDYDKADMRFAFKFRDMPRDEFRAEYGKENETTSVPLDNNDDWEKKDHVRVAEYFRRCDKGDKLHLMSDGTVMRQSEQDAGWVQENKPHIQRSRDVPKWEVQWFLIAGNKVIDRKISPGRYIPIVPWIGEEVVIDGTMDRRGHTRALIDPQRIYNYASSASAEFVGLQTKTPYIAAAEALEGNEEDWFASNTKNLAVLVYNSITESGATIPRPERERPPVAAPAYLELMKTAENEMMMVSGQYQSNFGEPSNEKSGVAINARQREGDNATYHYIDNHAKGVRQVGRICLDWIPIIYDTKRVIKIMAEDGTQSDVHVDPDLPVAHVHVQRAPDGSIAMGQDGNPAIVDANQAKHSDNDASAPDVALIFNPTVGLYDVEADVGPAFATQRQEAVNALTQVMQASPGIVPWTFDILARNYDWPGAMELAERAKRMVPAAALGGPPPEVQHLQQQIKSMQTEAEQRMVMLQQQVNELTSKNKDRSADIQRQDYEAETRRLATVASVDPEAIKPIIRQLVSEVLQTPIVPVMAAHGMADAAIQQAANPQPAPYPQGAPLQQTQSNGALQ